MAKRDATTRRAAAKAPGAAPRRERTERAPRGEPVCPVAFCPIGLALTTVQQAGPEVVDHLLAAAREFLLAARAVVDQRAGGLEARSSTPLEKIEIG